MQKIDETLEVKRVMMIDEYGNIIGTTSALSLVTDPANELSTFFLSKEGQPVEHKFKVSNSERQEITGAALVPNKLMKREYKDKKGNGLGKYYYIFFTEEDVRAAHDFYRMYANSNQSNPEHLRSFSDKIRSTQSWIIEDEDKDKANALGFDMSKHPVGTWMHTFKVVDKEMWNMLKESDLTGFSPELSGFEVEAMLSSIEMPAPFVAPGERQEQELPADSIEDSNIDSSEHETTQDNNFLYQTIKAIVFDREMSDEIKYKIVAKILRKMK